MLGELYDGEFASMEHNGRMDACMSEEISREEIAALLARGSEEMTREQAHDILRNAAWLGTDEEREKIEKAVELLCGEPCEDEYIKVPKKALKYRTAGMVAYNAEWLKNHFDIERAVICGEQELCEDVISRQDVLGVQSKYAEHIGATKFWQMRDDIKALPPVTPQTCEGAISRQAAIDAIGKDVMGGLNYAGILTRLPPVTPKQRTGHWIYDRTRDWDGECKYECSECGMGSDVDYPYCMRCGAKMIEPQESEGQE